jgi:NhaC family Na+:H+ antiporter
MFMTPVPRIWWLSAYSGTVTSPLVPWNSCGAFMGATLGVPALVYLPYCFFNIASPVLDVIYGFTGFRIGKVAPSEPTQQAREREEHDDDHR